MITKEEMIKIIKNKGSFTVSRYSTKDERYRRWGMRLYKEGLLGILHHQKEIEFFELNSETIKDKKHDIEIKVNFIQLENGDCKYETHFSTNEVSIRHVVDAVALSMVHYINKNAKKGKRQDVAKMVIAQIKHVFKHEGLTPTTES